MERGGGGQERARERGERKQVRERGWERQFFLRFSPVSFADRFGHDGLQVAFAIG